MNIRETLGTNLQMKFLSFFLAANFWLFLFCETVDELKVPLEVNFVNVPQGLKVQMSGDSARLLSIEGPKILLLRQKLKGVPVVLDVSGYKAGLHNMNLVEGSFKLVKGVKASRYRQSLDFELVFSN